MNKVWILVKREYKAAVRTKGFIVSLVMLPIFMGGGFAAYMLLKDKVDLKDKTVLVIDESQSVGDHLVKTADYRNANEIIDEDGDKTSPSYLFKIIDKESDFDAQKLALSERVRDKEIHGFVHIGPDVINPGTDSDKTRIIYYAENAAMGSVRRWIENRANDFIRQTRISDKGLDEAEIHSLFSWVGAEGMGLVSVDSKTGDVVDAKRSSELESFLVPYVMMLLIFMMLMMSAIPLLQAVMEEKSYRIAEVLLGSVTPWQFMLGKVLGGLAVSLTTAGIYIGGIFLTLRQMPDLPFTIPYDVLPWFFVYLVFAVVMYGSVMASLGSTCNDSKDAQNIQFPAMLPMLLPMFLMMPIIQNPMSGFAMWTSLFPPFTPMLMLVRQATPVEIPMWQPIVGVIGMVLFTILAVWAGGRIFRSSIIMVGKRPKFGTMMKYIIKG